MGKLSFKEFVEQEKEVDARKKSINWKERKKLYIERLNTLFQDVKKFLCEFEEVVVEDGSIIIEEESIGKYKVPSLSIRLFDKHAQLIPVGTNILGTPGRVDLVGDIDAKRIILADTNETSPQLFASISWSDEARKQADKKAQEWLNRERDYVWKFLTNPPILRYIEFDKESFLSSLQEVLDV